MGAARWISTSWPAQRTIPSSTWRELTSTSPAGGSNLTSPVVGAILNNTTRGRRAQCHCWGEILSNSPGGSIAPMREGSYASPCPATSPPGGEPCSTLPRPCGRYTSLTANPSKRSTNDCRLHILWHFDRLGIPQARRSAWLQRLDTPIHNQLNDAHGRGHRRKVTLSGAPDGGGKAELPHARAGIPAASRSFLIRAGIPCDGGGSTPHRTQQ